MALQFKKATRSAVKLKILITGPSGAGKTFGALHLANGLAPGKIGLIDSEHRRSGYYADAIDFEVLDLDDHRPKHYKDAIQAAVDAGLEVCIVDSLSHCWTDILTRKDAYDAANPRSNRWTNWGLFGGEWDELIRFILEAPIHVICTGRSKMAHEQIEQNGRKEVVKLGLAPQLRDNTEYDFAVSFHLEQNHSAQISKDNTNLLSEKGTVWDLADGTVPALLREWLSTAKPIARPAPETSVAIDDALMKLPDGKQQAARKRVSELRQRGLDEEAAQGLLMQLHGMIDPSAAGVATAMTLSDAASMKVMTKAGEIILGECEDAILVQLRIQAVAKKRTQLLAAIDLVQQDRATMKDLESEGAGDSVDSTPDSTDDEPGHDADETDTDIPDAELDATLGMTREDALR